MKPAFGPRLESEAVLTHQQERSKLLAGLRGTPAWAALKELIQTYSAFYQIDLADPNYGLKSAARDAKIQMSMQLLRAVEKAEAPVVTEETTQ